MDKNFINVDDLVRQRLEGREEREPSGAWLNMRELLDEKMPQRKVVPFFWNRMFGAVGIAALLGLISVGGYELSAYKELGHTAPVASAATVAAPTGTAHNDATPTDVAGDRSLNATGVTDNVAKPADAAGVAVHKAAHKKTGTDNTNNTTTKTAKNNSHTPAENTATTGIAASKATDKVANNNTATTPHSKKNTAKSTEAATAVVVKHSAAKNNKDSQPVATATEKVTTSTTVAGNTATTTSSLAVSDNSKPATTKHAGEVAHHKAGNHKTGAASQQVAAKTTAGNSANAATANDKDAVAKNDNTTDVHNMPLSSNSTPANNASESVPGKVSGNNMVSGKASLPAGNSTAPGNTTGKPANTTTGTTGNGTPKTATVGKLPNNTTANNSKGKKVIERMVVFQRAIKTVKTELSESKYHIDTVSIETLTEELGMANPAISNPANSTAAKKGNLGNMINTTTDADGATILPGAASSATNAPGAAAKTNAATKNSSSLSPVEKLKEEFNDVKTKVSLIRFAPGLTAGINSTFFGPNSFKGFQFGLTGELFFNDDLGLMGEFKYFHRINNDYQVNDNYYNYLNNGTKQLMLNSYSFSALHSMELPISIRYSKGNFTFIAGGNIVYSFSINTGAATIASPTAPVATNVSPAQATDNKPQLNASDFNSRFGLGYLFGFAYKVSPNVTLDLRDVQSFWDNAGSAGAKSVSTQLYKSPSFQFSLNYRLGKKNRGE